MKNPSLVLLLFFAAFVQPLFAQVPGNGKSCVFSGTSATVVFSGSPNFLYDLQRSTNLTDWVTLESTNIPAAGQFRFDDFFPDRAGKPPAAAFYRLKTAGPAVTLVVSGFPSPVVAGVVSSLTVTAKDAFGNIATGYRGTVHFTSSDGAAVLPANYTFVAGDAGVNVFLATLKTVSPFASITVTDTTTGSITGTQAPIVVNPAGATTLVVTGFPGLVTAGVSSSLTVTAKDAFGNTATGYRGTVRITSGDSAAVLPANYTFVPGDVGIHGFSATLKTVSSSASITATDTTTGTITGTQAPIVVTAASAVTLVVAGFPSPTVAGVSSSLTVTARDAFGNVATGYRGTVRFASSDGAAILSANYTFLAGDAGVHGFSATLKTVNASASIMATDTTTGTITGTQGPIVVTVASAVTLVVAGFPSPVTAGVSSSVTVTARDAFGNVATGYRGTVRFASSDGAAILSANYTFLAGDAGVHGFSATLKTVNASASIMATDTTTGTITGTQGPIVVTAASAVTLVVAGFPSPVTAGVSSSLTVTAKDAFGNTATGYRGTVRITSSDSAAVLPANYSFVAGDAGVHGFPATLKTVSSSASITATDTTTGSITGTQSPIVVN